MQQKSKKDFLWTIKTHQTLQLWPVNDEELSLTKPYLPSKYVNTKALPNITSPTTIPICWLDKFGFEYSAISTHTKQYYSEHQCKKFSTIMFTISGSATLKTQNKIYQLEKGTITLSPITSTTTLRVRNTWQVLWFHIKKNSILNTILGKKIISQKSEYFDDVISIAKTYANEIYKDCPDEEALQCLAKLINIFIRRDISKINPQTFTPLTDIVKHSIPQNATKSTAQKLGISVYELNKKSKQQFGQTFSKKVLLDNMSHAQYLLQTTNLSIAEISKKVRYSNSQSFSKAFSKMFKISPRLYRQKKSVP